MLSLRSPAKINLFLRIIDKRPDGFHNLASLFQAIDLCDILHFSVRAEDRITCSDGRIPCDHRNLVAKARDLFRQKTGINNSFDIHIEKKIPIEAGLGGGSGNAATTLWGLNQLCQTNISSDQLRQWGSEIGSDVAFFFSSGTAYCTGRGEIIEDQPSLPYQKVWIVKPDEGLATKEVYGNMKLDELVQRDPIDFLRKSYESPQYLFNDMEQAAFKLRPSLKKMKEELLNQGFETVMMSGSGTSFFCLGEGNILVPNIFATEANFINRMPSHWYL